MPNTGEVERLADMFTEYNASYRLGTRTRSGESYADETSYFAGDLHTTTLLKGVSTRRLPFLPDAHLAIFGARDLFDESDLGSISARSARNQKSRHFFPISAICTRLATTLSTWSTVSASITD